MTGEVDTTDLTAGVVVEEAMIGADMTVGTVGGVEEETMIGAAMTVEEEEEDGTMIEVIEVVAGMVEVQEVMTGEEEEMTEQEEDMEAQAGVMTGGEGEKVIEAATEVEAVGMIEELGEEETTTEVVIEGMVEQVQEGAVDMTELADETMRGIAEVVEGGDMVLAEVMMTGVARVTVAAARVQEEEVTAVWEAVELIAAVPEEVEAMVVVVGQEATVIPGEGVVAVATVTVQVQEEGVQEDMWQTATAEAGQQAATEEGAAPMTAGAVQVDMELKKDTVKGGLTAETDLIDLTESHLLPGDQELCLRICSLLKTNIFIKGCRYGQFFWINYLQYMLHFTE